MDEAVFDLSSPSTSDDEGDNDSSVFSDEDCELDDIIDAMMAGGSAVPALSSAAGDQSSTDQGAAAEGLVGADSDSVQGGLSTAAGADGRADASEAPAAASPAASAVSNQAAGSCVAVGAQLHDSASDCGDDRGGTWSGSAHGTASQHSQARSAGTAASQHSRASSRASPSAAAGQAAASQCGSAASAADPGEGRSRQDGHWHCCGTAASSAGSQSSASESSAAGGQTSSDVDWVQKDYTDTTESIAPLVNMLALHGAKVSQ